MAEELWDAVIVGAGPAGLTAAVMLGRSRRRVLVIDAGSPRNRFAAHMHGVLGLDGLPPSELRRLGRAEAEGYGVVFHDGTVREVTNVPAGVRVTADDGSAHQARTLVIATGLRDDLPAIGGLAERWGKTVLHCPYCHGWEVRNQHLGVLATSPLALHQVELVRQLSDQVTFFSAGAGDLSADDEKRLAARGIRIEPAPVTEIHGPAPAISQVALADGRTASVDAIFTAGTLHPLDEFVAGLDLDRVDTPVGSFLSVDRTGQTSHERIWAAGNVVDPGANVAMSLGAGAITGGVVNARLAKEDTDTALATPARVS